MTISDRWMRRIEMRRAGATNAAIAGAEGVKIGAIAIGFSNLRRRGYDIPLAPGVRPPRPGPARMTVLIGTEARRRIRALSGEFGKSQHQVLVEIIQGAVVDVPGIARNLLDPEA